jgi:hypothetical protein
MAEDKASFVLYADYIKFVNILPDDTAGQLFKLILEYVNDLNPDIAKRDLIVQSLFEVIKSRLKRDLKEWEKKRAVKSAAGKKGAEAKWGNKDKEEPEPEPDPAPIPHPFYDKDKVGVFTIERCKEIALKDSRWVKAAKVSDGDLIEFNKVLEKRGEYEKNILDYKKHFANWKNKVVTVEEAKPGIPIDTGKTKDILKQVYGE